MQTKKTTIVLVILSLLFLLAIPGCPAHVNSQYGVKVMGDGSGGAIAVYEDTLGGNIYIQKISTDGHKLWGEKGVLLNDTKTSQYRSYNLDIISDISGGAIAAWPEFLPEQNKSQKHLARIDSGGKILWEKELDAFQCLIGDEAGGAIVCFDNEDNGLIVTRIDLDGNYVWGPGGITVPTEGCQYNTVRMIDDGTGGAIVAWKEVHRSSSANTGANSRTDLFLAQRISAEGNLLWGENCAMLTDSGSDNWIDSLQIINDGTGCTIAAWFQITEIPPDSSGQAWQKRGPVAQKIDAGGHVNWQPDGIPLEISIDVGLPVPDDTTLMVSDGSGGAILSWRDHRAVFADEKETMHSSLFAQRIGEEGSLLWQADGEKVSAASLNPRTQMVSDGSGGAVFAYGFQEDYKLLHTQRVDADGHVIWQENGVTVTEKGFAGFSLASDGQGGIVIGWGSGGVKSEKAYVQRMSVDGELMWGAEGVRLN